MAGASGPKTDDSDQMMFVRKVLGIVSGQLLISFIMLIGASVTPSDPANCYNVRVSYRDSICMNGFGWLSTTVGCQITAFFVYIFTIVALLCSKNLRQSVPFNYILLFLFTVSMGFIFAGLTAWLTAQSVLISIGVLVVTLMCLFGAALLIKARAAVLKGILIGVLAAVFLQVTLCLTMVFSGYVGQGLWILYCTLGVLIASALIYFDLFIIMLAGKYAMDEYIYCAILLYVDIMRLLLYILMIFGKGK